MKKFKIAITNCNGFNQLGLQATKADLFGDVSFTNRKNADNYAKELTDYYSQFEGNNGIGFLVCRKTPRRGWVVVAQF